MAKEYERKIQERIVGLTNLRRLKEFQLSEIRKLDTPPSESDIASLKTQIKGIETAYSGIVKSSDTSTGGGIDVHADLGNFSPDDAKLAKILAKKYEFLSAKAVMYEDYSSLGREEVIAFYEGDIDKFAFKINLYGQYKKKSSNPEEALKKVNKQIADCTVAGKSIPKELVWAHKSLNHMVTTRNNLSNASRKKNQAFPSTVRGKGPREYC